MCSPARCRRWRSRRACRNSLMARLDRFAPVKEVAQIGAAIGREFSYELLAAVARRPESQLRDALDQLVDAGSGLPPRRPAASVFRLQARPRSGCCLRHLAAPPAPRAPRGHCIGPRRAARSQWRSRPRGEHAALLAHHWLEAEDWEKALSYTLEAAEQAAEALCPSRGDQPLLASAGFVGAAAGQCRAKPGPCGRHPVADFAAGLHAGRGRARRVCCGTSIERLKMQRSDGNAAAAARLQAIKGSIWDDEALLMDALARAEASGDALALAVAENRYGQYLGIARSVREVARTTWLGQSIFSEPKGSTWSKLSS